MKKIIALAVMCFSLPAFSKLQQAPFISLKDYSLLKSSDRKAYISAVRKAFLKLEESKLRHIKVSNTNPLFSQLIESAEAANSCLLGGLERPVVSGKCSTENNECNNRSESYKCGALYGGVCISRVPVESISRRCFDLSDQSYYISAEEYAGFESDVQVLKAKYCDSGSSLNSTDCDFFTKRLNSLSEHYKDKAQKVVKAREQQAQATSSMSAAPSPAQSSTISSPSTSAANCMEANSDTFSCVNGTMTVRKNDNFAYCKEKEGNTNCREYELLQCIHGIYENGIEPAYMQNYLTTNQSKSDVAGFAEVNGLSVEASIKYMKDSKSSVNVFTDASKKSKLETFAVEHNKRINACEKIASLKQRIEKNREFEAACKKQEEAFNSKDVSLSELSAIGQKNSDNAPSFASRCGENKPPRVLAIHLVHSCTPNGDDKCIPNHLRVFPTSFEWKKTEAGDRGVLEYIDSQGRAAKTIIVKSPEGHHQVLQADGNLGKILTIKTAAPCNVARMNQIPLGWNQSPECHSLVNYSMDKEYEAGMAVKASKEGTQK